MVLLFCSVVLRGQSIPPSRQPTGNVPNARISPLKVRLPLTEGRDIRFKKLNGSEGLSQTRVSSAVQDDVGFMWFATQYGLNRYDGYKFKLFKHEPDQPGSLSCVYIRSLIKDRSGALWVGCDSVVDKFDPVSETFTHFPIHTAKEQRFDGSCSPYVPGPFRSFHGWRPQHGLYKLDPSTGRVTRYRHDPSKPWSLSSNLISSVNEDRKGELWVASRGGLDAFDRGTGRIKLHVPLNGQRNEFSFHEDKFGTFWIAQALPSCPIGIFDRKTNTVQCYAVYEGDHPSATMAVYSMLESRDGTMWLASVGSGLLKYDRANRTLIRYKRYPEDSESLASNPPPVSIRGSRRRSLGMHA